MSMMTMMMWSVVERCRSCDLVSCRVGITTGYERRWPVLLGVNSQASPGHATPRHISASLLQRLGATDGLLLKGGNEADCLINDPGEENPPPPLRQRP